MAGFDYSMVAICPKLKKISTSGTIERTKGNGYNFHRAADADKSLKILRPFEGREGGLMSVNIDGYTWFMLVGFIGTADEREILKAMLLQQGLRRAHALSLKLLK